MNQTLGTGTESAREASVRNTVILQAAAALLIANSHLEPLYPKAWMAADGFIGNSIFFLLSGYGITISLLGREQTFVQYYLRRIFRIYPALWLVEILFHFLLQGAWKSAGGRDYLHFLVYPTAYGYVRQIMVFYVLFYLLKPWLRARMLVKLMALLCLPLLGLYAYDICQNPMERLRLGATNDWLWWVFFFQIMVLGGYLALPDRKPVAAKTWPGLFLLGTYFAVYVALKFLMVLGIKLPGLGFTFARLYILLFLLIPLMLYHAFTLGASESWLNRLKSCRPVQWAVALVGGLTLEIYIVHVFVLENEHVQKLLFPLNVAVFFLVTIGLAWGINQAARLVRRILEGMAARKGW
jgi:peptidoglycan/LPS O-acetylase OafA/YrhL